MLHIGTMKSGTTSIQSLLFGRQRELADQGVLPLGTAWADQVAGVRAVLARPEAPGEPWQRLVRQARDWDGTSVISMEYLGPFGPRQVRSAVASFGDLPVEVVVTMRDLNRTVPSLWQEAVQNGRPWTWSDYRSGARAARPWQAVPPLGTSEPGRTFWRQQDAHRMVRRWADAVGADRVTVVTVPPPGGPRTELLDRFGEAVGFRSGPVAESRNAALGAASAQLLQLVNARLAELGVGHAEARRVRKRLLAKQVLSARRAEEQPIGLEVQPWVEQTAARMVKRLQGAGVRLVGDWADLTPVAVPGVDPEATPQTELAAAATYAFDGLRAILDRRRGELPTRSGPAGVDALARLVLACASREAAA